MSSLADLFAVPIFLTHSSGVQLSPLIPQILFVHVLSKALIFLPLSTHVAVTTAAAGRKLPLEGFGPSSDHLSTAFSHSSNGPEYSVLLIPESTTFLIEVFPLSPTRTKCHPSSPT